MLKYRIDAARLARVNNPANLKGLAEVHRGDNVWLMLYYTVLSIPRNENGISTYQIIQGNRTIFSASYSFPVGPPPRSYTRFDPYTLPKNIAFGLYTFRATVKLDNKAPQSANWQFAVVRAPNQGP